MLKFKICNIIILAFAISCSTNKQNKKQAENNTKGYPNFTNAYEVPTNESKNSNDALINKLQGVWAENKDENAVFMIKRDTIIYTENLSNPFKYNIVGDTLAFKYPEGIFKMNILKATGDSLVISNDGTITRFYNRRKNW